MLSAPLLFLALAATLIVGAAIGYFSRPGPAMLVERMREQAEAAAAYCEDAEDRIRAANQRATALEDEAAALRSDHADAERTIAAFRAPFAEKSGTEAEPPPEPLSMTPTPGAHPPAPIGPAATPHLNGSGRDDLTRIPGIDAAINTRLFSLGVLRFEDLEKLSDEDEMALEERLNLPAGLIAREQWRAQAAKLR